MIDTFPFDDRLLEKTVSAWLLDLDDRSIPECELDAVLSPEERERASRFHFEEDARHFRLCRAVLRFGLAIYLRKAPSAISIRIAERGKPYVERGQVHFNISHCRSMGLLAFTSIGEIGVDVEEVRPAIDVMEIADKYFTANECAWIASADKNLERSKRFTRLWTRKEAVLKATGKGVLDGLNSFDISPPSNAVLSTSQEQQTLNVLDFEVTESIFAAIAGPDCNWDLETKKIRGSDLLERIPRS